MAVGITPSEPARQLFGQMWAPTTVTLKQQNFIIENAANKLYLFTLIGCLINEALAGPHYTAE